MLLAVLIFLFTLVLVIWQPRFRWQPDGLGIGWSAALGAVLALLTGAVHLADIPVVWAIVWNATLTFIALIIISLILDEAGFFRWAALHVARWGGGRGHLLFALVILLGAAVSALFANDGTALILTPIVLAMLTALGFQPRATLAFILATGFIADSASLPLVISNLVNIVSADYFNLDFGAYAAIMVPVDLAAILASLGALYLMFRRQLPPQYDPQVLDAPGNAIRDQRVFQVGWIVLGLLLLGYFTTESLGLPVSAVAISGAALLWGVAARGRVIDTRRVLKGAPWQIVMFSLGMYLVVYGLRNAGLTDILAGWLDGLAARGLWAATFGTGLLMAAISSAMNNMPSVLIGALAIDASGATGTVKQGMIYANIIGNDLGPKITPIGSLATLLWLHVLAGKGIRIGWGQYFRVGIVMTVPVLLVTLAALALRLSW
ncbi:arsenic transporter [Deinococcus marmoris]|uniref:Arsenical pump membrane protein n=1 Tax=Deinococcus marmoris TaxID=249408 RepID=A0A1U7P1C0_9DEIO|nr:arsenic transporter [Deinococcus marmoris]OLV18958.1 Arsenic efflux pump protein [Deinococcus marmoris]